ncbi:MAG: hypothetical protein HRT88_12665 [Lentisphaeraceae bacterium]|nr:hypothetical protein [Lentisphaeraceae bacterium]
MIHLNTHRRLLGVILALGFLLSSTGVDRYIFQALSRVHASIDFPCQDQRCSCDFVGYELPNCACDHLNQKNCCENSSSNETQELASSGVIILKDPACAGFEDDHSPTFPKLVLLPIFSSDNNIFLANPTFSSCKKSLFSTLLSERDKIPI